MTNDISPILDDKFATSVIPSGLPHDESDYEQALYAYLAEFLTPQRRQRFQEVLGWRTRWITLVLTDVFQQQNTSAVLRTCDAYGIQGVHVVESVFEFQTNPQISLGSDRWLTLCRHSGPDAMRECIAKLRAEDYRVVATVVNGRSQPIEELPLDRPVALLMGTERDGLPSEIIELADDRVHVPMYGFVESFNVSVAAALCLCKLVTRLHSLPSNWRLSPAERQALLLDWTRKSIPGAGRNRTAIPDQLGVVLARRGRIRRAGGSAPR